MIRQVALYEIPKNLETLNILDGSILPRYNELVQSNYNSEKARSVLSQFGNSKGELTGSNPFMAVCLQNSGLLKDSRIATRQDLETALRFNSDIFFGNYLDFGLALRTAGDEYSPNDLLAKNLANQLKAKGIKLGKGKLLNIADLTLREDKDSEYGVVFDLKEEAKEFADLSKFKWDYTKDQGLAGAYLGGSGNWDSNYGDFGYSSSDGRVALVSGGSNVADAKIFFDKKLTELQARRDAEIEAIGQRYAQAEKILRG